MSEQRLRGMEKRQQLQEMLRSSHGSLGAAFEAITGVTLYKCPKETLRHVDTTRGFRRISDEDFEACGAIVHVKDGACAKKGNFFGMLAAFEGYDGFSDHQAGYDIAEAYVFQRGYETNFSEADKSAIRAKEAERAKVAEAKKKKNKAKAEAIMSRKAPAERAHAVYQSYMQSGRNIKIFESEQLSSHICFVEDLEYFYKGDDANNGRKFPALVFPLSKRMEDGTFKIFAMHAVYLERTLKGYIKAKVEQPKQDLGSWDNERGLAVNLSVHGNRVLFVGEGNETVAAYYAAFKAGKQSRADFKFTNTASRLASVCVDGYDICNILVDRDKSGAGMSNAMKLRYRAKELGKQVTLLPPPSGKVPLYVYVNDANPATTIDECIKECSYWRAVDASFANEAVKNREQYVPRYQSFVVVKDSYDYKGTYPYVIKESDIPANIPYGVDWDNVIKYGASFAFELFNLFKRAAQRIVA